jgi:hypothetical protein
VEIEASDTDRRTYIRFFRCARRTPQDQKTCPSSSPFESILNRAAITHLKEFLSQMDTAENYYREYSNSQQADDIQSQIDTTKQLLQKTERGLQRLIARFRNIGNVLAQAIEREIDQITHEKKPWKKPCWPYRTGR